MGLVRGLYVAAVVVVLVAAYLAGGWPTALTLLAGVALWIAADQLHPTLTRASQWPAREDL